MKRQHSALFPPQFGTRERSTRAPSYGEAANIKREVDRTERLLLGRDALENFLSEQAAAAPVAAPIQRAPMMSHAAFLTKLSSTPGLLNANCFGGMRRNQLTARGQFSGRSTQLDGELEVFDQKNAWLRPKQLDRAFFRKANESGAEIEAGHRMGMKLYADGHL